MKFSIITPTYKRRTELERAVRSVFDQTHTDWEMIIVNDSPSDTEYDSFEKTIYDPRVKYLKNKKNEGVNFSRNHALDSISKDSERIIFLDDDDYLANDTLKTFVELIFKYPNNEWFVTDRASQNGDTYTKFPKRDTEYSYAWDYLITKRCKGDATHCIKTTLANKARFSKLIKQAEEWLFFYQIGLRSKIFYHSHNSTLSDGYNEISGLNFRKRAHSVQLKTLFLIIQEGYNLNLLYRPTFLVYIFMRLIRLCVKP